MLRENKIKSSQILEKALSLIESGTQSFACAAIQDVETDLRYANNNKDVKNNAMKLFMTFKPASVKEDMKLYSNWWPKGDPVRIVALKACIALAKKKND